MRNVLLAACLVAASSFAGLASAASEPLPTGRACGLVSNEVAGITSGTYHGVIFSRPVAAAELPVANDGDLSGNPESITLTCALYVNDDPPITTSGSGTAVAIAPPLAVTYTHDDLFATLAICSEARVTDAHGNTQTYYQSDDNDMWYTTPRCDGWKCLALGANCDYTLAMVEWALERTDPTVCAELGSLAPGVPGIVDIDPTGDTYITGEFLWDCQPYES